MLGPDLAARPVAARLGQRFADEAQIVRGQRPARPGEVAPGLALVAEARDDAGNARLGEDVVQSDGGEVFRGVAEAGLQHGEFGFQGGDSVRAERIAAAPVAARLEGGRIGRVVLGIEKP